MKKIIIASGLLALMAAATSCDEYDIYPEQYGDVMMIKDAGEKQVTIYATDDAAPYYIAVMKGGHNPGDKASATLRVMNEADFKKYKEHIYGDAEFVGLQPLKSEFYHIEEAKKPGVAVEPREINHEFAGENDRYFGANVILDAQRISDWREAMESRANYDIDAFKAEGTYTDAEIAEFEKEKALATDSINNFTFVVPMGLYSATDSVNADNYYVMVEPVVKNPVLSVNVDHCGYQISEISRVDLIENEEFRKGVFEPEVIFSIPCENPYGFKVKFDQSVSYVRDFNSAHTDMQLAVMPGASFNLGTEVDGAYQKYIEFPAGVKEVRLPMSVLCEQMNPEDVASNWAVGIQLKPSGEYYDLDTDEKVSRPGKNTYQPAMIWPEGVPAKVKKSLELPAAVAGTKPAFNSYTFFVGYKVVETPLVLDDGCVTSNDCEPSEGSIAALFDGDLSTFFHSGWTVANPRSEPFGSYLEIEVPSRTLINACYFQFTSRVHSNPMSPKEVHLYYTNESDPALRELPEKWTYIDKVVLKKKLGSGETGELGSLKDMVIAKEPYKYLRFCVVKNAKDESLFQTSTAIYWNLAELRMYGKYIDPAAK